MEASNPSPQIGTPHPEQTVASSCYSVWQCSYSSPSKAARCYAVLTYEVPIRPPPKPVIKGTSLPNAAVVGPRPVRYAPPCACRPFVSPRGGQTYRPGR